MLLYGLHFTIEAAYLLYAERQQPGDGQHGQGGGYGKYGRQQVAGSGSGRHGYQHAEVEDTAGGAEGQGKQYAYQQGPPAATACQSLGAAAEPELWQAQPVAEEHEQTDEQQQWPDERFAPRGDGALDAEHAGAGAQNADEHHAQQGVAQDAAQRVEQPVAEDAPAVARILAYEAYGSYVGGQRTGR